ncbi:MAG: TetR/AcrR family transcriptional regulator, partial [Candidatus Binatia bacterium]
MTRHASTARTEDSRSTRDLVLDIAERLFAEKGFAGVSMRAISAEAGLRNQASLYHHFRHKRALYEAVMARGIGRLVDLVTESGSSADVLDRVIDFLAERPHLPRLIQRVALDDHRHLGKTVSHLLSPLYEHGVRVLAAMGG